MGRLTQDPKVLALLSATRSRLTASTVSPVRPQDFEGSQAKLTRTGAEKNCPLTASAPSV